MIIEHIFDGRRPSLPQLHAAIRKARAQGATYIVLRWGENQINLEASPYTRSGWTGHGWIGRNGGQDISHSMRESAS
jgi:hypothetical protein